MSKSIPKALIVKWIEESYSDLKRYAKAKMGFSNASEDTLSNAIIYVLKNKDRMENQIQSKAHLTSYIKLKFSSEMKDYFRQNKKENVFIDPTNDDNNLELTPIAFQENTRNELRIEKYNRLNIAMSALTSACRELLTMKSEGFNDVEISQKLNVPVGTVGSRGSRCLKSLRNSYFEGEKV